MYLYENGKRRVFAFSHNTPNNFFSAKKNLEFF